MLLFSTFTSWRGDTEAIYGTWRSPPPCLKGAAAPTCPASCWSCTPTRRCSWRTSAAPGSPRGRRRPPGQGALLAGGSPTPTRPVVPRVAWRPAADWSDWRTPDLAHAPVTIFHIRQFFFSETDFISQRVTTGSEPSLGILSDGGGGRGARPTGDLRPLFVAAEPPSRQPPAHDVVRGGPPGGLPRLQADPLPAAAPTHRHPAQGGRPNGSGWGLGGLG